MRILHVINCIEIGGAETFLLRLINELENQGHVNFLMTLTPENNNQALLTQFTEHSETKILQKKQPDKKIKSFLLYKINGLYKRLSGKVFYEQLLKNQTRNYYEKLKLDNDIEIINSHLMSSDFFAADTLKPAMNLPLVITSQGCYNDFENIQAVSRLIDQVDGLTYVADKNLKVFHSTGKTLPSNRKLIYNGLEFSSAFGGIKRSEIGLEETDFVVGQISRSIETKGMEIAINAVIHLHKEHELHTLKLVLIGPENDYYTSLKEKYSEFKYIVFPGVALKPTDWVGMFDLGILPSYFPGESCPSSIVEYLSLGKPVIATDIGEIPNMIKSENGVGGKIISKLDEKGIPDSVAFADEILWYFEHPDSLKKDCEFASSAFAKFDISQTTKEYLGIYKKAILRYG
ncbi:MAG: glycosyltransferase family 4 protein [Crocinitomicaceae bacterium]